MPLHNQRSPLKLCIHHTTSTTVYQVANVWTKWNATSQMVLRKNTRGEISWKHLASLNHHQDPLCTKSSFTKLTVASVWAVCSQEDPPEQITGMSRYTHECLLYLINNNFTILIAHLWYKLITRLVGGKVGIPSCHYNDLSSSHDPRYLAPCCFQFSQIRPYAQN